MMLERYVLGFEALCCSGGFHKKPFSASGSTFLKKLLFFLKEWYVTFLKGVGMSVHYSTYSKVSIIGTIINLS